MNPERQIDVEWNLNSDETFPVKIRVRSLDRVGLLADIVVNITKHGANILSANTESYENKMVACFFTLAIENTEQLNRILSAVRKVKLVQSVQRIDR
jgi:GTP pyrophosphokinase